MDGRRIQPDRASFGPPSAASSASSASAAGLPPPPLASLQGDDQDHRCTGRVRMRRWLMTQVMSGRYSGLKWIDREKTLLRIPWKHGSRSGWSAEDGKLFESWAIQSGKFDPHHPNARKWKANFRCALRSLPDVEEVKNLSHKTGKDAYKIFRFLPEKQRKRCYKTTRSSWRQTYLSRSMMKTEGGFIRPDIPVNRVPTNNLGLTDTDRKLVPDVVHRRLCFPSPSSSSSIDTSIDRSSPSSSRYRHPLPPPPPPSSMSFYRIPDVVFNPSSLGNDLPAWSMRAYPLPTGSHPSASPVYPAAPYNDVVQCDQYPNPAFASPALAADPPLHCGGSFRGVSAYMTTPPDSYVFNSDLYNAGTGEYNDMTAYPPVPGFEEMSISQPEMTDISNLGNVPQWTTGAASEGILAEFFDVMQAVLRDKSSLGNDIHYSDDLDEFEGKPGHP